MQDGICIYCGKDLYRNLFEHNGITIEHIIPMSKNGRKSDIKNVAICCEECNFKKGSKLPNAVSLPMMETIVAERHLKKEDDETTVITKYKSK